MFTAHSVGARHLAIKPVIGTFEEEDEAFDKMMLLTWLMPLLVAVATILDVVLMAMMMTVLHPWRRILQEVRNNLRAFFRIPELQRFRTPQPGMDKTEQVGLVGLCSNSLINPMMKTNKLTLNQPQTPVEELAESITQRGQPK